MKLTETEVVIRNIVADEGKTFARKEDGEIVGASLWLGKNDSPDNYIEVDAPAEEPAV